jgi:MFS family permease
LLDRLPPFAPALRGGGALWRRPGLMAGNLAGVTAGTWRALLGSYVPVALVHAGRQPGAIGLLVSVANGASLGGSALLTRVGHRRPVRMFLVATLATGVATALVAWAAPVTWLEVVALAVSGVGAGVLQALGPAIASDSVEPEQRGDAIAIAGTYRAAALFAAPLLVGISLAVLPLSLAVALTGAAIAIPAALAGRIDQATRRVPWPRLARDTDG